MTDGATAGADPAELLTRVDLFAGLSRVDLAKLAAHLDPVRLGTGEVVVRQGEPGDSLYVVARGAFGVWAAGGSADVRVATLGPGDVFGEMALFTGEARSATVRADDGGEVLRLARPRFLDLVRQEPGIALALGATLSRRLHSATRTLAEGEAFLAARVEEALSALPFERRQPVLEASLLDEPSGPALAVVFGTRAGAVAADLAAVAAGAPGGPVRRAVAERLERELGPAGLRARAGALATVLGAAGCWDEALGLLARHASADAFRAALARALRAVPPLPEDAARRWVERVGDAEAAEDPELALARARLHEARGDAGTALAVLRRALGAALVADDAGAGRRLSAEVARLADAGRAAGGVSRVGVGTAAEPTTVTWSAGVCLALSALAVVLAAWPGNTPAARFVWLLASGLLLMLSRLVPDFGVALGLIAGWVLLGVARPAEALAGFASKEWLFVLAIYGLAAATARSGVLFRVGLLLVRRLPHGLVWQTATLLLTGLALTPLVPSSTGRASLTSPLALAVAEALRLPERSRASALLGLGTWMGAGPMMFTVLSGSGTCLLAWGLLPEASRARFTWVTWLVAAAPLGALVCLGGLAGLYLILRPPPVERPPGERVRLQVAVLGPPGARELVTIAILLLTVAGWMLAPILGTDLASVALLGLLAAVATGTFDRRAFQALDWNFLVFFGVVLSIARVSVTLGLDRAAASVITRALGSVRLGPLTFMLAVALLSLLVRLVMDQDLTVLLAGLTLIPVAPTVGVDPWVVVMALLATSVAWFLPSQTPSYLVAQGASEGRLFSHEQARRFAVVYTVVTLVGLALMLPYWRLLGLV